MRCQTKNWFASVIFTLAVLVVGFALYQTCGIRNPILALLQNEASAHVEDLTIRPQAVELVLRPDASFSLTEDLGWLKYQLRKCIGSRHHLQLRLVGHPTPALMQEWSKLSLLAYDAMNRSELAELPARLQQEAGEQGMTSEVVVEDQYLLIALKKGENVLYQALPFPAERTASPRAT